MSTTELFEAFEADTSDHKKFEALIKGAIAEADLDTLETVYQRFPEWAPDGEQSRLFQVLMQQARMCKVEDVASFLHFHNGVMVWKEFGDAKKAEMSFRKMKGEAPDRELLKDFYIQFYAEQRNWRRLEQFLKDPKLGGMEDAGEMYRLLAQLAEEGDQPDKAAGFWQKVYDADPSDVEAEEALRRLYAAIPKWHALIDLLKSKLKGLGDDADPAEKIAIHREMIDIYKDELNAGSKAIGEWNAILELDPGNREALDALATEYEAMKRWPDLVKVLQRKADHVEDVETKIELLREIASIMMERFNNATEAIKAHEQILELDPANREAIRVLKEIYESRRDFDSYIRVAEAEVQLLEEGAERDEAFLALARLAAEKIRKPETPIALWERVLEADPHHPEALEQLESLYEREKNYEELVRILDLRAEMAEDGPDKVALLEKLGMTASSRLHDEDQAANAWRRLLELDRDHRKAQAELKKKYLAEGDWENLEWFFRNYMTVQDWVRTLESQAKSMDDPTERTSLLFKAAAVWQDELGETRRAVKNLEAVLELEPRHAQAAGMLVPIYRDLGSWDALPNVYDIVLEATEDVDERRRLLLELAEVQEQHLHDVDSAFFAYVQAVQESPNATELHAELKRLAELSGNWDSYVVVLQETVELIEDPAERVAVLLEVGYVYRDRVELPEMALEYFNRVLALDDANAEALDALQQIYTDTGAYALLLVVLDKKLEIVLDADARRELLLATAAVWREHLGNNAEAEAIYTEMLEDYPTFTDVHDQLISIYLGEERFAPLRDVLERKRDILLDGDTHRTVLADIEAALGMLSYGVQPDEEGAHAAVDHYEAALEHDGNHAETVARLEEMLAAEGERGRITRMLEPVYEARAEWKKLADILEIRLLEAEAIEDDIEAVALLERLAELYGDAAADEDLAWRSYARLFTRQPEREDVRQPLEELTEKLERWPALVELYTEQAEIPADAAARLAIKLVVARAWHERIGDLEQARVFYHNVLDEEPEHAESIDALETIYIELDRADALLDIYRRKVELSPEVDQKLDYLFRTSDLLRDRLERYEDAVGSCIEALDLKPGHLPAMLRLDELYTATEQWEELTQLLGDLIEQVGDDTERVVVLKTRLGGLRESKLEDVYGAVETYAEILALDPDNQAVVEALERLFEIPEHAAQIAPILEPYYDRQGDWTKLVAVYSVREEASDDPLEKVDWHYKIAALYEEQGQQPESAFEHYMAAASQAPGNETTLGHLLRLGEELDNHAEVILHLQSLVEDIDYDDRRKETHRTIATLCRDKTGDVEGAEKHLRAVLDIDPGDMDAVDALIALARQEEEPAKLVDMLLMKAPMVGDVAEQQELYAEAGELCATVLGDSARAIEIYETLHNLDPSQDRALTALEQLYEATEDWEQLNDVYRQRIERAEDLETKKYYAALRGGVQADKQGNLDDAIFTWRQILEWSPGDVEALDKLDELYTEQEDWFNLLEILRAKQELLSEDDPEDTAIWAALQFRVARLFDDDEQLGDPRQAIAAYGALLERAPEHEDAIDALKAIVADRDEREEAFAVLRPVLLARGDYEDLWSQYEIIVAHQEDDAFRQVSTLHEMAALAEGELEDFTRAFESYARAFRVDSRNEETIRALERLAETYGLWEDLVALYGSQAEEADDDFQALELRLKNGAFLVDRIGDPERAIEVYKTIVEDHPEHEEALGRLHDLYTDQEMYPELAEVLRAQFEATQDPAQKIDRLMALGAVTERRLGDPDGAFEAFNEVLYLDDRNEAAIGELQRLYDEGVHRADIAERLEPIYTERQAWPELQHLLELKLEVLDDPLDQMAVLRQIADLNLNEVGSKPEAITWYGRAFRLDPEDEGLRIQLRQLGEETERWAELKEILMDAAEASEDDERRIELWLEAAVIARDRLGDTAEAERVFLLVREADEDNYAALQALDAIYVAQDRLEDLESVLAREAHVAEYDDDRIALLMRLAELYRALDRPEDAVAAYREVLDINDMHRPALLELEAMHRADERWEELYEITQQLVDTAREDAERAGYTAAMARIAEEHLDRAEDAVGLWEDVLAVTPDSEEAIHELERLLEAAESWQSLVEAYERELRMGTADDARRLELYRAAGRVWQHKLDDLMAAQSFWERAREEAPYDKETLEALRLAYREGYNFEGLAGVLEAQLASEEYDEAGQLELWRELAEIRTEQLQDASGAIDAWNAVLALAEGDRTAIENLESLYESEQRWADAVELFRIKLYYTEDEEERIQTWLYAGAVQQEQLQDNDGAAQTYRDLLEYAPGNMEASQRLESIYEAGSQWAELAQLLAARNEHIEDPADKLMNLQRLAALYEHQLEDPASAFVTLSAALELAPEEPQTLSELARLGAITEQWSELRGLYDLVIEHLGDEDAVDALLAAALIERDHLGRLEEAAAYFARVLEVDGEHEEALRALVDLDQQLERWEDLVAKLHTLADVTMDYGEKKGLYARAAGVLEESLGDRDRAVESWESILDLDEVDGDALGALERLQMARGDWRALIEVWERMARADSSREVELKLKIADVLERNLEELDEAIMAYEDVLTFDPGNEIALEALEAIYGEREDWAKLIEVWERASDAAQSDEDRTDFLRRIAMLHLEVFKDADEAAEAYQRVLYLNPSDAESLDKLEAIYTERGRWDELVELFEKKHGVSETAEGRAAALHSMAGVYRDRLQDVDQAISTYERLLSEVPGHAEALQALAQLYESQELWGQVVDVLERMLNVETDRQRRLDLLCRQGELRATKMEDQAGAAQHYERALAERPGYDPAVDALVALHSEMGNWAQVVEVLERKLQTIESPHDQAPIRVQLASVLREHMGASERALAHLEAAVQGDSENVATLWPLAEHYVAVKDYPKAMPLLDVLVDKLDAMGDHERLGLVHKRLGQCAEAVLDPDRALDEYRAAVEEGHADLDTLRGLARLTYARENWEDSRKYSKMALDRFEGEMGEEEVVKVYLQLGESSLRLGQPAEAKKFLGRVIEKQPTNAHALEQIIEVLEAHQDWPSVIAYREQLLDLVDDPLRKYKIQFSIGDIYLDRLGNQAAAEEAYKKALNLETTASGPLLQLLRMYVPQQRFTDAIRILNRLIQQSDESQKKGKYAWMAAVMYRDNLHDEEQAIKYMNLTLDFNVSKLEAFQSIDQILTRQREWKALEQNYRKMIQRVQKAGSSFDKGPALLFTLYRNLGEVYRSRLRRLDYAISAYELASKSRPNDTAIREILAELHETQGDLGKAVDQHRYMVARDPQRFESYHKLYGLYRKAKNHDHAWCVAGLLCTLGKATDEEDKFYHEYVSQDVVETNRVLDDTAWHSLVAPEGQVRLLGEAFFVIYQMLGKATGQKTLKDYGLKKRDRLDLSERSLIASVIGPVSRVLNITPPDIYRSQTAMGIQILPTYPLTMVIGPDMEQGQSPKALAFRVAKHLTYMHRWHVMAALYDHRALDLMFLAAATLADPGFEMPIRADLDEAQIASIQQQVGAIHETLAKNSTAQQRTMLQQIFAEYWAKNDFPKIGAWHRAVELTANHAGLLAADDIELVGSILRDEVAGTSKLGRGDKLKDLVIYGISDRYFKLREALGVKIDYSELFG